MSTKLIKRGEKLAQREQRVETMLTDLEVMQASKIAAIGAELEAIRDEKLYLETHSTFEEYIQERWGKSRRWGYYTIQHTQVVRNIGYDGEQDGEQFVHTVHTEMPESQTRELAKLPAAEQKSAYAEAQQAAKEDGKQAPTQKHVKEAVAKRKSAAGTPLQAPSKEEKPKYLKHLEQAERLHGDLGSALYAACNENDAIKKGWFEPILKNLHRKIQEAKRV